jgi:hypothetical protein
MIVVVVDDLYDAREKLVEMYNMFSITSDNNGFEFF